MAPQLETVDVALNAFYGYPMLSPTTRSSKENVSTFMKSPNLPNLTFIFYNIFFRNKKNVKKIIG